MSVRHPYPKDYNRARQWARELLLRTDWLILDTETTGLGGDSEAIQIGVTAPDGTVMMNVLVRPSKPIPPDASRIHGITDEMVEGAPTFAAVRDQLHWLTVGKLVVIYNAGYDVPILRTTARLAGVGPVEFRWECAMLQYAAFVGDWNSYRGNYRWQKLPALGKGDAHDAIGDCLSTLEVIRLMAEAKHMVEGTEADTETKG